MAQVLFRNIRSSAKDLDCELFYSELKHHNVSLYLLSSHRYSYRVENDNTVLIKGLKKGCKC